MIAAKYEAIPLYQQTAESTDHMLAQGILMDIADEEREHAGELLRLLQELDLNEKGFYVQGVGEAEVVMAKLKKQRPESHRRLSQPI